MLLDSGPALAPLGWRPVGIRTRRRCRRIVTMACECSRLHRDGQLPIALSSRPGGWSGTWAALVGWTFPLARGLLPVLLLLPPQSKPDQAGELRQGEQDQSHPKDERDRPRGSFRQRDSWHGFTTAVFGSFTSALRSSGDSRMMARPQPIDKVGGKCSFENQVTKGLADNLIGQGLRAGHCRLCSLL